MGNGEAKELICTTHRHELRGVGMLEGRGVLARQRGIRRERSGTTVIA